MKAVRRELEADRSVEVAVSDAEEDLLYTDAFVAVAEPDGSNAARISLTRAELRALLEAGEAALSAADGDGGDDGDE